MHTRLERNRIAVNLWTARIVPIILAGIVGYATYVLVALLCVNYLLNQHHDTVAAISILVIYFVLFLFMAICFFRLVYITVFEPPYVPLGLRASRERKQVKEESKSSSEESGIGGTEYDPGAPSGGGPGIITGSHNDPDSPGLELFYTKEVFVCDMDGKPKWCSQCANWKPDRAHHSSDCGRCIRKMDHFCPWVGGAVGENNFKFFIQFTGYTALYCTHLLVVMAIYVAKQKQTEGETLNPQFAVILGLATFFGLFTFGMTVTSIDLAMDNYTQVEKLGAKSVVHILAVLKPPQAEPVRVRQDPNSQSFHKEIKYPLDAGLPPNPDYYQPAGMPRTKSYSHARPSEPIASSPNRHSPAPAQRSLGTATDPNSVPGPDERSSATQPIPLAQEQIPIITAGNKVLVKGLEITAEPAAHMEVRQNATTRERLSKRDLKATRTFAILPMLKAGDNPWDLGSRTLNLKTVMGTHVLDWFLPIRRSPCCYHENTESQFQVGPSVDLLKSSVGFIPAREPRTVLGRRRRKRRHYRSEKRATTDQVDRQPHGRTYSENDFPTNQDIPSSQSGSSIPMQDFVGASPASRLG